MNRSRLNLHTHILPGLQRAMNLDSSESAACDHEHLKEDLSCATVFDCRGIDFNFMHDTSVAAYEQAVALGESLRLPFHTCYFEFDNGFCVLAQELMQHSGRIIGEEDGEILFSEGVELGNTVEIRSFNVDEELHSPMEWWEFQRDQFIEVYNGVRPFFWGEDADDVEVPFFSHVNNDNPATTLILEDAMRFVFGIVALMSEKLISEELIPDDCQKLNKARAKRGRPPLGCEHRILTLNVAAVRRAAVRQNLKHESPRLHWRRGHWRTMHRGSEFESRTWVRRCLVGDPDRGYVTKDYRVVWEQPMLVASA